MLMTVSLFISCNKDDDGVEIGCTYVKDPECFCLENPNNPLCNVDCSFETNPDCFCQASPTDPRCCTFEIDPDCFCQSNPNDPQCATSGPSSGFHTFFDFENQLILDSIFETGYIPDNPDGWQSDAKATPSFASGDAPQGNTYFVNEIQVLNANWAWTSNLRKRDTIDLSSLREPTLNFWVRTSNSKPMLIEIGLVDDSGESGYHPGGVYAEVNGDWKQFSLNINRLNNENEWKWGDGIDVSTLTYLKFGFNIEGQDAGDIFEVHIDDIYINDGVPAGAIEYPKSTVGGGEFYTYFDFENQPIIDSIFDTGYIPDNPDGWQENGKATASLRMGDAPEGDFYFVNEIEVLTAAWTWTSNLFLDEPIDASSLATPTLNFWVRTSNAKPLLMEFGMVDDSGESGWHPGGVYEEVNGDWQLFSVDLKALNDGSAWQWGDGIDMSQLSLLKFGFNIEGQTEGDIFEVHIDKIYLADGAPSGAITYPK